MVTSPAPLAVGLPPAGFPPAGQPFVLLDDARDATAGGGGAAARLYVDPVRIVSAAALEEVRPALEEIRAAGDSGLHAAGFVSYDAAAAFEPALRGLDPTGAPLLWFGLFADFASIAPRDVPALLPDPSGAWNGPPEPAIDRAAYDAAFAAVQARIVAGDLYQANLTYRAIMTVLGDPRALYARLRGTSQAGFGGLIDTGAATILSLSPELFFALDGTVLTSRPMKGTARRGATPAEDKMLASALASDPKQRAENLMIVDLMRNDLARVARPGSVTVPQLFEVETYPTVHQLVSTVTAEIAPDSDAIDVFAAVFPCGVDHRRAQNRGDAGDRGDRAGCARLVYRCDRAVRRKWRRDVQRCDPHRDMAARRHARHAGRRRRDRRRFGCRRGI